MATITQGKAIELVRAVVIREGSQTEAAKALDISVSYLSEILRGTRKVSDNVARKLGYKRVVVYEKDGE